MQPTIEWLLQRTFGEQSDGPETAEDNYARNIRTQLRRGLAWHPAESRSHARPRKIAGRHPAGRTPRAENVAAWPAVTGRVAKKPSVNALITNRFPELLQPNIERVPQRTFREQSETAATPPAYVYERKISPQLCRE
jgi:hypothetical protein